MVRGCLAFARVVEQRRFAASVSWYQWWWSEKKVWRMVVVVVVVLHSSMSRVPVGRDGKAWCCGVPCYWCCVGIWSDALWMCCGLAPCTTVVVLPVLQSPGSGCSCSRALLLPTPGSGATLVASPHQNRTHKQLWGLLLPQSYSSCFPLVLCWQQPACDVVQRVVHTALLSLA